ncbi:MULTISPECIES: hypothetical protein [Rikenellaceae]|uniref:hypothetical protein n=1 Tax=Rikenellaceae TaxID=171550 RepID=UPI00115FA08D|nr:MULTISPECIES: hypothetical protein [Rikenellaceae]
MNKWIIVPASRTCGSRREVNARAALSAPAGGRWPGMAHGGGDLEIVEFLITLDEIKAILNSYDRNSRE